MSVLAPVAYRVEITRVPPDHTGRYGAIVQLIDDGGPLHVSRVWDIPREADVWEMALSRARYEAGIYCGVAGEVIDRGLLVATRGREEWLHQRLGSRCAGVPCACGKPSTGVLVHDDDGAKGRIVSTGPACCEPCAFSRAKAQLESAKPATKERRHA